MVLRSTIAALAAFVSLTHAWLPNDSNKPILDKRGFSLFESEAPKGDEDLSKRWTPGKLPIRGVNLGSLFVFEPWTDWQEWQKMGCSGYESEFDCVMKTGRDRSNTAFQNHYRDYINENDLNEMMGYGLNTIRVPLGYWLKEDLVESSAYFPKGGLDYLTKLVGWASDRGFYIILDLHGAPGAQQPNQPFTGQKNPNADFYNDYNYGRAIQWLEWMTKIIHTNTAYRNVGMLELVNEPLNWNSQVESLRSSFYKNAVAAIRKVEDGLSVKSNDRVHIQMMNSLWGSGNPTQYIGDKSSLAFDDHRYIKWDGSVAVNKDAYIRKSCDDNRNGDGPTIVGEWSIAVPDNVEKTPEWSTSGQKDFYKRWFAAQVHSYEKYTLGWIFWTWKANLGDDYRWSYQSAVKAGVIPKDFSQLPKVC